MHWDEHIQPSIRTLDGPKRQLEGYGAPTPTLSSKEVPLIEGRMKTFPNQHPSLGSINPAHLVATGCPAIVYMQMDSDQWKSNTQATMWEKTPTLKKGREGKKVTEPLFGTEELYFPPREVFVEPKGSLPTISRDQRVFKHMGTLTKAGQW